ncbi:hypothetical protein NPIL_469781 [Nephila pilipes]|uniref:Uncharacterized protein n=1 Tax=Nephila pilipes TaxID=299642 RepID=A0A8X6TGI4_NEPPI|nr:hypothetical protein NPIL_469781 [Nephila pilipes]
MFIWHVRIIHKTSSNDRQNLQNSFESPIVRGEQERRRNGTMSSFSDQIHPNGNFRFDFSLMGCVGFKEGQRHGTVPRSKANGKRTRITHITCGSSA